MLKVYAIVLTREQEGYYVYVPDLDISTQGKDLPDALFMARDAIGLWGLSEEDNGRLIPEPKPITNLIEDVPHNDNDIVTLVDVDFIEYRKRENNRTVKKNCTIPGWLNVKAEEAGVNCSKILTDGLMRELGISK